MKNEDLTHKIIGCAYKFHNTLGFGFFEGVYKKAMVIELQKQSLTVEEEKPLKVYYEDHEIGDFYIDLFINNEIIVELKALESLNKAHEVQRGHQMLNRGDSSLPFN